MFNLKEIHREDLDDSYISIDPRDPTFWTRTIYMLMETREKGIISVSDLSYYYKVTDRYGQLGGGNGYVYILECVSQPGICKIGSTGRTPEERCTEINHATGVIVPWTVSSAFKCKAPECVEKLVHKQLRDIRINPQKEGFLVKRDLAEKTIQQIIKMSGASLD
jgi:hypothetical protein